jgi:hypothetical protein
MGVQGRPLVVNREGQDTRRAQAVMGNKETLDTETAHADGFGKSKGSTMTEILLCLMGRQARVVLVATTAACSKVAPRPITREPPAPASRLAGRRGRALSLDFGHEP